MSRYRLDDAAVADLEKLAADSTAAAYRTTDKPYAAFALLAAAPGIGHRRQDLMRFPVLFWPVDAFMVVYRRQSESVDVVAVAQGSRDLTALAEA